LKRKIANLKSYINKIAFTKFREKAELLPRD